MDDNTKNRIEIELVKKQVYWQVEICILISNTELSACDSELGVSYHNRRYFGQDFDHRFL